MARPAAVGGGADNAARAGAEKVPIPVAAARYGGMRAAKDCLLWYRYPVSGVLGDARAPAPEIVELRVPGVPQRLTEQAARFAAELRSLDLQKPPGLAETIDWVRALTALGKTHEVETHTRGALNNGLTPKQISEVLIQTAIYCGVPAAVDSFRAASKVINEHAAGSK